MPLFPYIRALSAAVLVAAALFLPGCSIEPEEEPIFPQALSSGTEEETEAPPEAEPVTHIKLPLEEGKSLNPFITSSENNRAVGALLYETFLRLSPTYEPENGIGSVARAGTVYTLTIEAGKRFWDGSSVTADDVLASLEYARNNPGNYPLLSTQVESWRKVSDTQVEVSFFTLDINGEAVFRVPICKAGTLEADMPVGTGRFMPAAVSEKQLSRNPYYTEKGGQDKGNIMTAELIPVDDNEALGYMLKIGSIDLFYNLEGSSEYYSYGSSTYVPTNRLTFLGVNHQSRLFQEPAALDALLKCIDKKQLAAYACGDGAEAVASPFHPFYYRLGQPITIPGQELTPMRAYLEESGYTMGESGFYEKEGTAYIVRLLVNEESKYRVLAAEVIRQQLAQAGILVQIEQKDYDHYIQDVGSRNFDLYLGEIRMGDNMDVSRLLNAQACDKLGLRFQQELYDAAVNLQQGLLPYDSFIDQFTQAHMAEPLLYRHAVLGYSRDLSSNIIATEYDIFYNIQNW